MRERDPDISSAHQGLFNKYKVIRTDGKVDHEDAEYFVLRLDDLDTFTRRADRAAVAAYAAAIHETHPQLAVDLARKLPGGSTAEAERLEALKHIRNNVPYGITVKDPEGSAFPVFRNGERIASIAWEKPADTARVVATIWATAASLDNNERYASLFAQALGIQPGTDAAGNPAPLKLETVVQQAKAIAKEAAQAAEKPAAMASSEAEIIASAYFEAKLGPAPCLPQAVADQLREAGRWRAWAIGWAAHPSQADAETRTRDNDGLRLAIAEKCERASNGNAPGPIETLTSIATKDPDAMVRREALQALARRASVAKHMTTLDVLRASAMNDDDRNVRMEAVKALGAVGGDPVVVRNDGGRWRVGDMNIAFDTKIANPEQVSDDALVANLERAMADRDRFKQGLIAAGMDADEADPVGWAEHNASEFGAALHALEVLGWTEAEGSAVKWAEKLVGIGLPHQQTPSEVAEAFQPHMPKGYVIDSQVVGDTAAPTGERMSWFWTCGEVDGPDKPSPQAALAHAWLTHATDDVEDDLQVLERFQRSMPPDFTLRLSESVEAENPAWFWSTPQPSEGDKMNTLLGHEVADPLLALEEAWMRYSDKAAAKAAEASARAVDHLRECHEAELAEMRKTIEKLRADIGAAATLRAALELSGMPVECDVPITWAAYEIDPARVPDLAALEHICDDISANHDGPVMARTNHPKFGRMLTVTIPQSRAGETPRKIAAHSIAERFPMGAILVADPHAIVDGTHARVTLVNSHNPHSIMAERATVVVLVRADGSLQVDKDRSGPVGLLAPGWDKGGMTGKSNEVMEAAKQGDYVGETTRRWLGIDIPAPGTTDRTVVSVARGWTGITWMSAKGRAKSMSMPGLKEARVTGHDHDVRPPRRFEFTGEADANKLYRLQRRQTEITVHLANGARISGPMTDWIFDYGQDDGRHFVIQISPLPKG